MMKSKCKAIIACLMTACVLAGLLPGAALSAAAATDPVLGAVTLYNDNQGNGIVMLRRAEPKADGTVDISIGAYTTGPVELRNQITATDIVLVLDVSGQMADTVTAADITGYTPIMGSAHADSLFALDTNYGLPITSDTYYIQSGGSYLPVSLEGEDANNYLYYTDGFDRYYPAMASGYENPAAEGYPVVQFYTPTVSGISTTKMDLLEKSVGEFIDTIALENRFMAADSQHSIAIVKYAQSSYFDGTKATTTPTLAEGNTVDEDGMNYTQVVKGFTTVDDTGAAQLKTAMSSLVPGGQSTIESGVKLAAELIGSTSTGTDRAKTIVVFTDGQGDSADNDFSKTMMNNTLAAGYALKNAATTTIYTVSMAQAADSSIEGGQTNRFMHYLSNNYLYATGMNSYSEGDIYAGYYHAPNDTTSLGMIMASIAHKIGVPRIEMGVGATLVDSMSSYFEITENSLTVETVEKTEDGWGEPVAEDGLYYELTDNNRVLNIRSFDYDKYYISGIQREIDGAYSYGKMLLVRANAKPLHNIIDMGAAAHGGNVPVHADKAVIIDALGVARAEIDRATLALPSVTYSCTINGANETPYRTLYRMPGSVQSVIDGVSQTGYSFDAWSTEDVEVTANTYTMPNANIAFTGNLVPNTYNVRYKFDGVTPNGAAVPETKAYSYGETVSIEAVPDIDGYSFIGWNTDGSAVAAGANEFVMPARDVEFYGSFTPSDQTPYKTVYYVESLDGSGYEKHSEEPGVGIVGQPAYADRKAIAGFTFDAGTTGDREHGVILGNGSLVLEMYYSRNEHNVTYSYVGTLPAEGVTPADLSSYNGTYKYGEAVDMAPLPTANAEGYEFMGWYRVDASTRDAQDPSSLSSNSFTMPDSDVEMRGYFRSTSGETYKVSHWLQNADGEGYTQDGDALIHRGQANETVTLTDSDARSYAGYVFDANQSIMSGDVVALPGEPLELKLYYNRRSFGIEYVFEGDSHGAKAPTTVVSAKYGEEVTAPLPTDVPAGYTFSGWTSTAAAVTDNSFTMPAASVTLTGYFTPEIVLWKEQHFLQNIDGDGYDLELDIEQHNTTGIQVTANHADFPGFALNEAKTNAINDANGLPALTNGSVITNVLGSGDMAVQFYYDRIDYRVSTGFSGMVPTAVLEKRGEYEKTVTAPFGTTITLPHIPEAEYQGFSFSGWIPQGSSEPVTELTVPANNVTLTGTFTPEISPYTVRHLLENLAGDTTGVQAENGKYYTVADTTVYEDRRTGALVEAEPKAYEGFMHTTPDDKLTGVIAGDGSLVIDIHYDRNKFKVSYLYYDNGNQPGNPPTIPAEYSKAEVPFGTKLAVEKGIALSGYSFDGWHTNTATVTEENGAQVYTMPQHDVTFYGRFVQGGHTVSYNLNGGTGANGVSYSDETVSSGTIITLKAAPSRRNYRFSGWSDGVRTHSAGDTLTVNADLKLTALWIRNGSSGLSTGGGTGTGSSSSSSSGSGSSTPSRPVNSGTPSAPDTAKEFIDVHPVDHWAEAEVDFAYENGLMNGISDSTFEPDSSITRAMFVTILHRLAGEPEAAAEASFPDVEAGAYYEKAVAWASSNGIVMGISETEFAPDEVITREQMAAIIHRYIAYIDAADIAYQETEYTGYTDQESISEYAAEAVQWNSEKGFLTGYADGTFRPQSNATRAEAATIFNRVYKALNK